MGGRADGRLFDCYLVVDWSARSAPSPARPSADAIWSAELEPDALEPVCCYHRTRHLAFEHLVGRLEHALTSGWRVLIGFDFPYGYPRGLASRLTPEGPVPAWRRIWEMLTERIEDGPDNANNRFAVAAGLNSAVGPEVPGPFWGCPPRQRRAGLLPTSPGFPYRARSGVLLARTRAAETRLAGTQETWKLLGVGSVGSQALLGIPRLCRLRDHPALAPQSRVWPFETGFTAAPTGAARIVHAEIWPGIVRDRVAERLAREPGAIKDSVQVAELARWAAALDAQGELGGWFAAPALDAATRAICIAEEGWVLGA